MMELKLLGKMARGRKSETFNRTMMELKLCNGVVAVNG